MKITIAPSILAGNHANLEASMDRVIRSGARWLHIDAMDGHFVPHFAFGSQTVRALATGKKNLFFDVHLMLSHPEYFVESFAKEGADLISIHLESKAPLEKTLRHIKQMGKQAGIAINPETSVEKVFPLIDAVDLVLIMGVNPGLCGQKFIENTLEKIEMLRGCHGAVKIEVDGGINLENAKLCIQRGADIVTAGTAFFAAQDPRKFVEQVEYE
ncbi:MAG: ribulose-phosphate 3-epimerase [Puniceicoccales bacterium]|jgi:ribulose-phosphate 3-epimerase|nr:ribulose-phosphate 3-epimerase [Puniceicoccales bacterium]